jgi:hypothetical protein
MKSGFPLEWHRGAPHHNGPFRGDRVGTFQRAANALFAPDLCPDQAAKILAEAGLQVNVFVPTTDHAQPELGKAIAAVACKGYVVTDRAGRLCGRLVSIAQTPSER